MRLGVVCVLIYTAKYQSRTFGTDAFFAQSLNYLKNKKLLRTVCKYALFKATANIACQTIYTKGVQIGKDYL